MGRRNNERFTTRNGPMMYYFVFFAGLPLKSTMGSKNITMVI